MLTFVCYLSYGQNTYSQPSSPLTLADVKDESKNTLIGSTIAEQPPTSVALSFYDQNGKFAQTYTGVKVGEYYWMNNNFTLPLGASQTTAKQIDYIHECYKMFNFCDRCPGSNPTYWSYFGEISEEEKLGEFDKLYGQYYPVRPANKPLSYGKMLEGASMQQTNWGLPTDADILQLIAMCGNATTHEIRQYLSYDSQADQRTKQLPIPAQFAVGPYFGWFAQIPQLINSDQYYPEVSYPIHTNGYKYENNNKYGLNFVPAGSKFHNPDQIITENYGKIVTFPSQRGDFNGLNQVLYIKSELSAFALHDFPEMKYHLSMLWYPVRFCRQLTDKELGYKIYINQDMGTQNCKIDDWAYPNRIRSGEEILLEKVRTNKLSASEIEIITLPIDDNAPAGFQELPRGYIRGFYVQHVLENQTNPKSIEEIIGIAIQNTHLWLVKNDTPNLTSIGYQNIEENKGHSIYPNPVKSQLNISTSESIISVQVFRMNGELCATYQNIDNSIDLSNFSSGLYIVNIKTSSNLYTHKVFKE